MADRSNVVPFPVRLAAVKDALDTAGTAAEATTFDWPVCLASKRPDLSHQLDAEFSPADRPPEAA